MRCDGHGRCDRMDRTKEQRDAPQKLLCPSKDADDRFMQHDVEIITNEKLCCARCVYVWAQKTAECEIYERKPLSVLRGGECPDRKAP